MISKDNAGLNLFEATDYPGNPLLRGTQCSKSMWEIHGYRQHSVDSASGLIQILILGSSLDRLKGTPNKNQGFCHSGCDFGNLEN
jgi:hypothetical protein